ncbi:Arf family guanine nucleotide exchange factor GEA2 KNAG_0H01550 [Huiozyma naganishii CBS 8797]|uniref:SEC7 domain-containing protein n=1 Tax=Huiozyma naganishii (strain ATCC MYA-139 / BCRC 22969 / CBS 8797 / KCTC 17520 / NBRC 10181 / NCYC 3082 / Yp74L-3) TaxID=1071383 RepID=J7S8J1_HUIN7|nr:hypothetical protein KNAG_0H01550 [Kazachstania naganishii CBS 8797]CCK71569.1 hypothetical protein KNAG_0H01550 [Kazachstania naganishii CBS 8797]
MGGIETVVVGPAAVDPVAVVAKECVTLATAMRKYSKLQSQSGVAVLLLGGSTGGELAMGEVLGGGGVSERGGNSSVAAVAAPAASRSRNDPLVAGFIQLRHILNKRRSLEDVDSLTLWQPFLLVVKTASVSGYITCLALDALSRFVRLQVVHSGSRNHVAAVRELVAALTHCKFTPSQQQSDDAVLCKVVLLLEHTLCASQLGHCVSDTGVYDALQTLMSIACNTRRAEVLRRTAETATVGVTLRVFACLRDNAATELTAQKYISDESYSRDRLQDDMVGPGVQASPESPQGSTDGDSTQSGEPVPEQTEEEETVPEDVSETVPASDASTSTPAEPNYGLPVAKQQLTLLLSLITPENSAKHTNSARIFALQLINTIIECVGDKFPLHPRLFSLISDPIFKCILFTIQNTTKLSLLQATLQLFTTLVIILGNHLSMQMEMTLNCIFNILLDGAVGDSQQQQQQKTAGAKPRDPALKELLIEQISILWTRSPSFFTSIFVSFDCNLDRADLALNFLKMLSKLAMPEAALSTTENVPPICLEGLVSLVDDMYARMQMVPKETFETQRGESKILKQRERKTEFISCARAFNEKPKRGVPLLIERGFIESDSEEHIAKFLFENNSRMNKKTIGLLLCDPKQGSLLRKFMNLFDFKGLRVDEAIRILLTKFRLPGESQQIERIIEAFSSRYSESQDEPDLPDPAAGDETPVQPDADSVFLLSYSIIMLNTDLHNPQVKEHMSFEDYSSNLRGGYNSEDFPHWYLDKIYCSIRDKEIVMPEEHHGNERWFEDAWNNLISSTTVMTEIQRENVNAIDKLSAAELLRFDRAVFRCIGNSIVNTFFKIYVIASDDHITTRMLTSLDRCSYISEYFTFKRLYNDIILNIGKFTTIVSSNPLGTQGNQTDQADDEEIPLVEISLNGGSREAKVPVSNLAVRMGRSFRAQVCTLIFFRILKRTKNAQLISTETYMEVVKILRILFENLLINPDVFLDLQQTLKIGNLLKPTPDVALTKHTENRGLFSTFASYLKGDEEPTEEEIDFSFKALSCVENSKVTSSIFGNERIMTSTLAKSLIDSIDVKKTDENARFFEAELLFLVESAVALVLVCKDEKELPQLVLDKLFELSELSGVTRRTNRRLLTYELLLISVSDFSKENVSFLINDQLLNKTDIFNEKYFNTPQGGELINRVLQLTNIANYSEYILREENYWKFLRRIAAMVERTEVVFEYIKRNVVEENHLCDEQIFMLVLGLLDEISSIGAVGSRWEQEYSRSVKSGHKIGQENPYQHIIGVSLKSISLTAHLLENDLLNKGEVIAVIQALAHQCMNPCEQLNSYALKTMELSLTETLDFSSCKLGTLEDAIEEGLLSILDIKDAGASCNVPLFDILRVTANVYIYYLKKGVSTNDTYLRILNFFNAYVENPQVETLLQQLILQKKAVERGDVVVEPVEPVEPVDLMEPVSDTTGVATEALHPSEEEPMYVQEQEGTTGTPE